MRCEDVRDLLPLHPVDLLEPEEEAAVREHLESGCPRCAAEAAAIRETLGLLPLALPPESPSPMVKARLMAAVRKEGAGAAPARPSVVPAPPPSQRVPAWATAAAASVAAALITGGLTGYLISRRHEATASELRSLIARQERQMDRQAEELAALRRQVRDARDSIQLVSSPGVSVVDLAGQERLAGASMRIFLDRRRAVGEAFASSLPPAGAGKTYQLWLITPTAKISAGTFDPAATGEASLRVAIPAGAGTLVAAAVTDEPAGGSPQPTGSILLVGQI